ncbi:MAG: SDR family oxidoreductase [Myxococcales bacterium]|jgi:NAD(P)-dependent dehydrogenase (short-subunit alcohol dehydrogenase family)
MADDLFSIEGKRIFLTGGASGIGRMISEGLAERGARIFTCSRKQESLDDLVSSLPGKDVRAERADLSKMEDIERMAKLAGEHFGGKIDVLINNAGATWGAEIEDYPEAGWDKVFDLNVKALFFLTQQCLPYLREAAEPPESCSRVINVGSISGIQFPMDNAWAYHPAKAAVHHLTQTLAKRLIRDGIAVNAIAPGLFPSKMTAFMMPGGDSSAVGKAIPMGRAGKPSDMVGTVVYLASAASGYNTGSIIKVDGGSAL